jgi:hypothetical protein
MIRTLKTLLLLFIVVALPVQGLAAVVKASCGPGHHGSLSAVVAKTHHHDAAPTHQHDEGSDHAAADSVPAGAKSVADRTTVSKCAYCSACATCCFAAVAPPSALLLIPVHSSSENVVTSPSPWVAGFIPAGLERPPKPIFA